MMRILIVKVFSINIVSVNIRETKDTQINTPVPTVSDQLLHQLEIVTPPSIVPVNGT